MRVISHCSFSPPNHHPLELPPPPPSLPSFALYPDSLSKMDVSSSAPRPRGGGGQDGPLSSAVARDDAATRPDQVMTDDMRLAVSALGLLRSEGGPGGGGAPPPHHHHLDDHHDPSTSSSAASTSTWTTGTGTGTGTTSSPVTTTTTTTSEPGERGDYFFDEPRGAAVGGESDPKFIERVAQLPLVSGGLEWYERSKQTSRVVKASLALSLSL